MERVLPSAVDAAIGRAVSALEGSRLTPWAERTVVVLVPRPWRDRLVPRALVAAAAAAGDGDPAAAVFATALFLCYPLGLVMHLAPYGRPRHAASFLLGAFLLQFAIGPQWLHHLVTSLVSYLLFRVLSPRRARIVVPVFLMTYLSLGHLHRQYVNYLGWDLNFTMSQMVLTIKLYALSFNLHDGQVLREAAVARRSGAVVFVDRGTERCQRFAVDELPSLLEFLGYAFCFSTLFAGPAFEYRTYADACSGALLFTKAGVARGKIPSRIGPTLIPFLTSCLCLGLYIVGTEHFPFLDPDDPAHRTPVVLTEDFLDRPFYQRISYAYVSVVFVMMRYFFPWKSAEGSTNLWYGGFEGFNDEGDPKGFGHSTNVDIWTFLTTSSFRTATRTANKKTASWLSRYVYSRTDGSLVATYLLSAFWHGFYPGYYLTFLSFVPLMICERMIDEKISPHFISGRKSVVWSTVRLVCQRLLLAYIVAPFYLLSYDWSLAWWKSSHYYGHAAMLVLLAALPLLPNPKQKTI